MDYSEFCNNHIIAQLFNINSPIQLIDNDGNEITEYIIPEGVTTIRKGTFTKCSGLTSIIIPNSVTVIEDAGKRKQYISSNSWTTTSCGVFQGCTSLNFVKMGNNVSSIGTSAFSGCSSLSSITIPNSVTSIGNDAFYYCTNLSSVTIPNSVTSIGERAFDGCLNLKMVKSEISTPFAVNAFNRSFNATLIVPKGSRADYKNVSGWDFAFIYEEGETIYDREQTDEQGLYYTLKQAEDYSIYYSVTGHSDESSPEIVIPDNLGGCPVRTIEENAFNSCTNLSSITIPNSITNIGGSAFNGCYNLNVKIIVMDYSEFCNNNIVKVFNAPVHLLDNDGNEITEYIVPEGVTTIGESAFARCSGLISITIPNSITNIGQDAFKNCSGLRMVKSDISTPFTVNAFSGSFNATLVVPKGFRADYKSKGGWEFAITYEEGETIYEREQTDEQGLYYTLRQADDYSIYYSVTGHSDEINAEIVIPANLDGCPVRAIENDAFRNCSSLTSVKIGNAVSSIEDNAFANCKNLANVKMGSKVSRLGQKAFFSCSSLTSITLPSSLGSIGESAFQGSALTSVNIPSSVETIGANAFSGCGSLVSVSLEDDLISIGGYAFANCALTSITIPNSVTSIGENAFWGNRSLTTVIFGDGITEIGGSMFRYCSALTSFIIPAGVTSIGNFAFDGCSALASVSIPDGVTNIGSCAFQGCSSLASVTIPDGVTSIGRQAFKNCALTSIKLPESLTSLDTDVFPNSMKSIELPNSFTVIPENQFYNYNLQYVRLGNSVKNIGKYAFGSSEPVIELGTSTPPTIDKDAFPNVTYLSDIIVIVPDAAAENAYRKAAVWQEMTFSNQNNNAEVTVDMPGDLSFEMIDECGVMPAKVVGLKVNGTINADDFRQMRVNMKSLLRLDLSDCNIMEIPDNALKGKLQLQELTLPTKLQAIGTGAFQGCTGLTSAIYGDQLTTIGESAFQSCTCLTDLTLNNNLQTIGQSAFRGCSNLMGLLSLPSTLTSIGASAFVGTNYTSVKLPNALKTISDYAFYNLPIKQQLSLPSSVTNVGTSAFEGTKIESLFIPRSVKTIGNRAFANTQIKSLSIKEGVTSIGDEAFAGTPIQNHVTIPDGVTYLGSGAFKNSQLPTVFLPNSVTTLSQGLFQGCPNLDLVYVPDNYTAMSNYAFDGCGDLTILRLSANTASMGEYSLQNTPLEYVKVPAPVEVLPKGVLKNCKNLESLTLPANLKSVEAEALTGCTALRNLSVEAIEPPAIKDRSAIRGINTDLCIISIPTSAYRNYVLADYWGQFVQMRNDIAVETVGNGKIGFESVDEKEEGEEASYARRHGRHSAAARGRRGAAPQLAEDEDSLTYANNGSSVYVPKQGKVRFYIIPAEGEEILSATLDGEDIMPYIVDGVYVATADKRNAKLVVVFSGSGQGSVGLQGDVNGDGEVSVTDVGCVINYILEQVPETFIYAAADMNGDETISVTDVGYIINYILNDGFACRAEQNVIYHYGEPMLMPDTNGYVLALDGADAFIAFQMDIIVPEDANGCNVQLKNTGTNHQLACRRLAGGHYRVVCYSPNNETFQKGLTDLLTLASEGDMTVSNIRFTTESLNEVCFDDMSATPTGIANVTDLKTNDIKVYTLEGQLYRTVHARRGENPLKNLKPGIYLINERKYIVK